MEKQKSNCLQTHRISGNCYGCHVRIEGAHIISGEGGLARILCHECCPEHGQPKPKAMGAAAEGDGHVRGRYEEPPLFTRRVKKA